MPQVLSAGVIAQGGTGAYSQVNAMARADPAANRRPHAVRTYRQHDSPGFVRT